MFSTESVLSLDHADIYQGTKLILGDVSFQIHKGDFAYLIGRTGSGKTSLLKTLYADLWLQNGKGFVAGYSLDKLKPRDVPFLRRKIGIVFQDFQLFPDRTVEENLRFVL
jgi:cell division transport system ATP-binding protein